MKKNIFKNILSSQVFLYFVLAAVINLVVEILSRSSITSGFSYMTNYPLLFIYNGMIIMLTLSISMLFKHRYFTTTMITIIWIGLGIANSFLIKYRQTPLTSMDFLVFKSAASLADSYLSLAEMLVIAIAFLSVIGLMIWIRNKETKKSINYAKSLTVIAALFFVFISTVKTTAFSVDFTAIAQAYEEYGFAYCFSRSMIDVGISEPDNYSEEEIQNIAKSLHYTGNKKETIKPNIIYLQLESFFDLSRLKNVEFSEDPSPYFNHLKQTNPSGYLNVSALGGGTVNTEFEILTGFNLDFFGPGEYPYKTVLKKLGCETIAYNLKPLGYTSHAIHDHTGTFYDRHQIYPNLGFDSFTPIEYMNNVEYNEIGWAKDIVLNNEILKVLNSTQGSDFVFAVTVQAHGKYPKEDYVGNDIKVVKNTGNGTDSEYGYYASQIKEMDNFLKTLIQTLTNFEEDCILVIYGDHLPGLYLENEDLIENDVYKSEYIIWSNFEIDAEDKNLEAYQLSAEVFDILNIESGFFSQFNKTQKNSINYFKNLEMLQYDVLYGYMSLYGGEFPYSPTEMQLGTETISIDDAYIIGGDLHVKGNAFTPFSVIFIDGRRIETHFIDKNTLVARKAELNSGSVIVVSQVAEDGEVLSTTNKFININS